MRFLSSFFGVFFLLIFSPSFVFAQSYQLDLSAPEVVQNGDEVTVVLEVKDQEGNFVSGANPEITFDPGENVRDELLFDCGNAEFYDNCRANHQGVAGIFEISFILVDQPVNIEVSVEGERRGLRLGTVHSSELAQYENQYISSSVSPEFIQAGPWPSFWFFVIPFLLFISLGLFCLKKSIR